MSGEKYVVLVLIIKIIMCITHLQYEIRGL